MSDPFEDKELPRWEPPKEHSSVLREAMIWIPFLVIGAIAIYLLFQAIGFSSTAQVGQPLPQPDQTAQAINQSIVIELREIKSNTDPTPDSTPTPTPTRTPKPTNTPQAVCGPSAPSGRECEQFHPVPPQRTAIPKPTCMDPTQYLATVTTAQTMTADGIIQDEMEVPAKQCVWMPTPNPTGSPASSSTVIE